MRASTIRSGITCAALIGGLVMATAPARAQDKTFIIIDDEQSVEDLIDVLGNGDGTASVETDNPYPNDRDADAALRVDSPAGDNQKFNPNIPGWGFQIVDGATAADEFQYITFAWLKGGGDGMQLQLSAEPGGWGHRYNGGGNPKGWNPSIDVSDDTPVDWQVHTRDLVEDWGELVLNGMAFSPGSGDFGLFDHIVLHQSPEDPMEPQAVDAKGKAAAVWADIKQVR
jgi:hypothetical protein